MINANRTTELFALCESILISSCSKKYSISRTSVDYDSEAIDFNGPGSKSRKSFHSSASHLSNKIYTNSNLLLELTSLISCQNRSLLGNESHRTNTLILKIKSNINYLNIQIKDIQTSVTNKNRKLGINSQAGQEATNVVRQIQTDFSILTKGFKDILKDRSDLMKSMYGKKCYALGQSGDNDAGIFSILGNKPRVYKDICRENISTSRVKMNKEEELTCNLRSNAVEMKSETALLNESSKLDLDLTSGLMERVNIMEGDKPDITPVEITNRLPRPCGVYANTKSMKSTEFCQNFKDSTLYSSSTSPYNCNSISLSNETSLLPVCTPFDIERMEEQSGQSQLMNLIPDQNYQRERADTMAQMESNIVELGTIFNNLAVMVTEHREMVQRVEENIDNVNENINLSSKTLTKMFLSSSSNRTLFLKLFSILLTFFIFFTLFFA